MKWAELAKQGWLCSPQLQPWQKNILAGMKSRVGQSPNLVWLLSSGTQSVDEIKAIALSIEAILQSAKAVNKHLRATAKDRWLLTLPFYHIGGLSIFARAHLS